LYKALDDGVFETDLNEEKWVTSTELIGGELEADEDFEEGIYDRHDWNELLDIKPLVDLIEEESLGNDTHVWKELLTLTDGELGEEELLGLTVHPGIRIGSMLTTNAGKYGKKLHRLFI